MVPEKPAQSQVGDVTIVRFLVKRMLDAGAIEGRCRDISSSPPKYGPSLVLDFSRVEFISSAVLNKLIVLDRTAQEKGGRLVLCGLSRSLRDLFAMTRLDQVFAIVDDEEAALREFAAD